MIKRRLFQIVSIIIGLGLIIKFTGDVNRLLKSIYQIKLMENRILELEKKKEIVLKKYQYYQSEDFIEEEARNKLNMAKPGETIVILPPNLSELLNRSRIQTEASLPNWKKWWNLFF